MIRTELLNALDSAMIWIDECGAQSGTQAVIDDLAGVRAAFVAGVNERRERFALAALTGLCASQSARGRADEIAMLAVHIADATIAKLERTERTERKEERT